MARAANTPDSNGRSAARKFPLVETFARQLFVAEMGQTGMTWDDYARGDDNTEYHRQAGRFLEGWWDGERRYVVLDLVDDEMWLQATVGDEL